MFRLPSLLAPRIVPTALAPDLLFYSVFNELEALAGVPDRKVIHSAAQYRVDQVHDPIYWLRLVASEPHLELPQTPLFVSSASHGAEAPAGCDFSTESQCAQHFVVFLRIPIMSTGIVESPMPSNGSGQRGLCWIGDGRYHCGAAGGTQTSCCA
jgi:hypothetical protein